MSERPRKDKQSTSKKPQRTSQSRTLVPPRHDLTTPSAARQSTSSSLSGSSSMHAAEQQMHQILNADMGHQQPSHSHTRGKPRKVHEQSYRDHHGAASSNVYNRVRVEDLLNDDRDLSSSPFAHGSLSEGKPEGIICKINECDRRFVSEQSLLAHQRRTHAAATPFICPHCKLSYSTVPNLNKHVRSVHDRVRPYTCTVCPSTFAFKDGLTRHMVMVHEQVRPFQCPYCTTKFKTKAHLSKHSLALHAEYHGGQPASSDNQPSSSTTRHN